MSLTSHLRNSSSPVYQFFTSNFPNASRIVRALNTDIRKATTLDTPGLAPWEYGLIGTAFDYRVRYFFSITLYREFVAYRGAVRLGFEEFGRTTIAVEGKKSHYLLNTSVQTFFDSLDSEINRLKPQTRTLSDDEDFRLAQYCLVLALFEQISRARLQECMNSPLVQAFMARKLRSVDDFLALCPDTWINDMQQLTKLFADTAGNRLSLPAILNPTFEGSSHVGGADADLILANTLIDIKTKKNPNTATYYLYQLLGYVLLDYTDQYGIDSVGFCFARQGIWHTWDLPQYIMELGNMRSHNLAKLRSEFHSIAVSLAPL